MSWETELHAVLARFHEAAGPEGVETLVAGEPPSSAARETAKAIGRLQRRHAPLLASSDTRSVLVHGIQDAVEKSPKAALGLISLLLELQVISFGEFLDAYADVLERWTIPEASVLCRHLATHGGLLESTFAQQDAAARRVSRARLLGIVNAFEKKLSWCPPPAATAISELHLMCYTLTPMSFQGICNRGLRDCPGRHFTIPELPTVVAEMGITAGAGTPAAAAYGDVTREDHHTQQVEEQGEVPDDASESSSGSVRNFKQVGDKRRRTAGPTVKPGQRTVVSSVQLYRHWKGVVALLQDPVTTLTSTTVARALDLVAALHGAVHFFRSTPATREDMQETLQPLKEEEFAIAPGQTESTGPMVLPSDEEMQPAPADSPPAIQKASTFFSWKDRFDKATATYDAQLSFPAFSQLLLTEAFRRDLSLRTSSMLRELFFKRRTASASAFENLHPSLRSAIASLSDAVYRLQKQITSCSLPFPTLAFNGVPWFAVPPTWTPPATLASIVAEIDSQEVMMAYWKWDGCNESKEPSWAETDTATISEEAIDTTAVLNRASTHAGLWRGAHGVSPRELLHKRCKVLRETFLPVVRAFAASRHVPAGAPMEEADTGVSVIAGLLAPPTFSRERQAWYLGAPPNPVDIRKATVFEKLQEKWADYKAKVTTDEDPQYQIEEDEKIVKDSLFQWRCHRLLNLTNLQLYDYSHQDRDLRMKIREASLEDLIQAVIQKEAPKPRPST